MCCGVEVIIKLSLSKGRKLDIFFRNGVGRREEEEKCSFLQLVIKHENYSVILICSYNCSNL